MRPSVAVRSTPRLAGRPRCRVPAVGPPEREPHEPLDPRRVQCSTSPRRLTVAARRRRARPVVVAIDRRRRPQPKVAVLVPSHRLNQIPASAPIRVRVPRLRPHAGGVLQSIASFLRRVGPSPVESLFCHWGRPQPRRDLVGEGHQRRSLECNPTPRHTRTRPSLRERLQLPREANLGRSPRGRGAVVMRERLAQTRATAIARRPGACASRRRRRAGRGSRRR